MILYIVKYVVTAAVIVVVSEVAKRTERLGALIAALPLVTIMVLIWLHIERQGSEKVASHAYYTFWYVVPTLPMFLLMPWLLSKGHTFWISMATCVVVTVLSFSLTALVASRFGVDLIPKKNHIEQNDEQQSSSSSGNALPDEMSSESLTRDE